MATIHADFLMYQNETRRDLNALNERLMIVEAGTNKGSGKGGKPLCEQIWTSKQLPASLTIGMATKPETFRAWSMEFKDVFESYIPGIAKYLKSIEIMTEPISFDDSCQSLQPENNRILYRTLLMITSDVVKGNIRDVNDSGLEAWRRLHHSYDPMTPQRNLDENRELMYVPRAKSMSTLMADIQVWEQKLQRATIRKGCSINETMNEDFRKSILMSILPVSMEKTIREHADRYPTYAALRQRIENDTFMTTTGHANMINHTEAIEPEITGAVAADGGDDDPLNLALDALQKALKGRGKGKGQGQDRQRPDKGKGKGDKVCWRCGKKGHTQPECKSVNDKTRAPLAAGDKNRFRPIKLQHIEEQTGEEEDIGSLEMQISSFEVQ